MGDKTPSDHTGNGDSSHDEKNVRENQAYEYGGSDERRKSVALNIVENPLKVRQFGEHPQLPNFLA